MCFARLLLSSLLLSASQFSHLCLVSADKNKMNDYIYVGRVVWLRRSAVYVWVCARDLSNVVALAILRFGIEIINWIKMKSSGCISRFTLSYADHDDQEWKKQIISASFHKSVFNIFPNVGNMCSNIANMFIQFWQIMELNSSIWQFDFIEKRNNVEPISKNLRWTVKVNERRRSKIRRKIKLRNNNKKMKEISGSKVHIFSPVDCVSLNFIDILHYNTCSLIRNWK